MTAFANFAGRHQMILTLDCLDIKEPAIFTDWFFRSDTVL